MIHAIRQMTQDVNTGHVITLHADGSLRRQVASMGAVPGVEWQQVDTSDLPSKPTHVAVDFSGRLTVLAGGCLYREVPPKPMEHKRTTSWKEIDGPKEDAQ